MNARKETDKIRKNVYISKKMVDDLQVIADEIGLTLSSAINLAIREYITQYYLMQKHIDRQMSDQG